MKRLYLSNTDRKIAGVCGGLAEYLDIDSTLIRLIALLLFIFTGFLPMMLVYFVAWLVIPKRPSYTAHGQL